jgi:hypothetical protein
MSKRDFELKYNGAMESIAIPTNYANIANTSIMGVCQACQLVG